MKKHEDYKYIRAWGKLLGSYEYYIEQQQRIALADNAPLNAVYERDGKWVTADDIGSPEVKQDVENYVAKL